MQGGAHVVRVPTPPHDPSTQQAAGCGHLGVTTQGVGDWEGGRSRCSRTDPICCRPAASLAVGCVLYRHKEGSAAAEPSLCLESLVPEAGFEPAHPFGRHPLKMVCLPSSTTPALKAYWPEPPPCGGFVGWDPPPEEGLAGWEPLAGGLACCEVPPSEAGGVEGCCAGVVCCCVVTGACSMMLVSLALE